MDNNIGKHPRGGSVGDIGKQHRNTKWENTIGK